MQYGSSTAVPMRVMKNKPAVLLLSSFQVSQEPDLCNPEISTLAQKSRLKFCCNLTRAKGKLCTLPLNTFLGNTCTYCPLEEKDFNLKLKVIPSTKFISKFIRDNTFAGLKQQRSITRHTKKKSFRKLKKEMRQSNRQLTVPYRILVLLAQDLSTST